MALRNIASFRPPVRAVRHLLRGIFLQPFQRGGASGHSAKNPGLAGDPAARPAGLRHPSLRPRAAGPSRLFAPGAGACVLPDPPGGVASATGTNGTQFTKNFLLFNSN